MCVTESQIYLPCSKESSRVEQKAMYHFDRSEVVPPERNGIQSGGGVLPEKLGGGVPPASQNPYPIYDQNLRYSLPYL